MGKHALQGVEGFVKRQDFFQVDPKVLVVEAGFNPRSEIGDEEDQELKESIKANGVLEPLKVQKTGCGRLVIREGHRRHWACLESIKEGTEIKAVPVVLVDRNMSEGNALFLALNCNTGRKLSPLDEATAFERLLRQGFEVKEIADRIGRGVDYVYLRLKLSHVTPEVRAALKAGEISIRDAAEAAGRSGGDAKKQNDVLKPKPKAVAIKWAKREGGFVTKNKTGDPALSDLAWLVDGIANKAEEMGLDPTTIRLTAKPKKAPSVSGKDDNSGQQCFEFMSGTEAGTGVAGNAASV